MEDENELRGLINEYQKRLNEIEKDNENKSHHLKLAIETLMKEKDELSQRLIRANNNKLINILDEHLQTHEAF